LEEGRKLEEEDGGREGAEEGTARRMLQPLVLWQARGREAGEEEEDGGWRWSERRSWLCLEESVLCSLVQRNWRRGLLEDLARRLAATLGEWEKAAFELGQS